MIEIKYTQDMKGAERFGTCASCGKNSKEDIRMVRVIFTNGASSKSICLCDKCRRLLYEKI